MREIVTAIEIVEVPTLLECAEPPCPETIDPNACLEVADAIRKRWISLNCLQIEQAALFSGLRPDAVNPLRAYLFENVSELFADCYSVSEFITELESLISEAVRLSQAA